MKEKNSSKSLIFRLLYGIAKPAMRLLFGTDLETVGDVPGPYLLLSNHNTDFDCAFLTLATEAPISFVATENILRMGLLGKLATGLFTVIPHYKGTTGIATSRKVIRAMKNGDSVAMFPEGNRSFNGVTCPIPPATAKLARMTGGALVTYRLEGAYFSFPRWASHLRKGRITGRTAGVYTAEKLAAMTDEEVLSAIERDLYTDAYEEQKKAPVRFRGRNLAEGLESTLFMCPDCKRIGTLKSRKDRFYCACGFDSRFDGFGMINTKKASYTVRDLDAVQRKELARLAAGPADSSLFEDSVNERFINENHESGELKPARLQAYSDRFVSGSTVIPFEKITGIAVNQRNLLMIHADGIAGHVEFSGPSSFSALKYLYLYRTVCGSSNGSF